MLFFFFFYGGAYYVICRLKLYSFVCFCIWGVISVCAQTYSWSKAWRINPQIGCVQGKYLYDFSCPEVLTFIQFTWQELGLFHLTIATSTKISILQRYVFIGTTPRYKTGNHIEVSVLSSNYKHWLLGYLRKSKLASEKQTHGDVLQALFK